MNSSDTTNNELRAALVRLCSACGASWERPEDGLSITMLSGYYILVYKCTKVVLRDRTPEGLITQIDGARFIIDLHDEAYHGKNPFRL